MADICPSGTFFDDHTEICKPCPNNTYNHGAKFFNLHQCYSIVNREILYLNSTAVQCAPGWKGVPIYEDGEYEMGCIDAGPPSFSPIWSLTTHPSSFNTPFPTQLLNDQCTIAQQCNTFCCISWLIFFGLIAIYSFLNGFIAFRQLREVSEDIMQDRNEVTRTPQIAMVDIQEGENVVLREQDSMRVAIPLPKT